MTRNYAPLSVGLVCKSEQLVVETFTSQHTTLAPDKAGGIRNHNHSRLVAADYALDRSATGNGKDINTLCKKCSVFDFNSAGHTK